MILEKEAHYLALHKEGLDDNLGNCHSANEHDLIASAMNSITMTIFISLGVQTSKGVKLGK